MAGLAKSLGALVLLAGLGFGAMSSAQAPQAARPGDDFFEYVNGGWIAATQLPPDLAVYGASREMADRAEADVRGLIEALAAQPQTPGSPAAKIADLYAGLMDTDRIEARGIAPLKPYLDRIASASNVTDLLKLFGSTTYASPIRFMVQPHPDDPDKAALWIGQSPLGMPNRGYYIRIDPEAELTREAYRQHVERIMTLIGYPDPKAATTRIFNLETRMAAIQTGIDRDISVNDMLKATDITGLKAFAPGLDWDTLLHEMHIDGARDVVVADRTAVPRLALLASQPNMLEDWKAWIAFNFAMNNALALPRAFFASNFAFFSKRLGGIETPRSRSSYAISAVERLFGIGVGELYVSKRFPPEARVEIEKMIASIRTAFEARMKKLDWMDEATRAEALKKLDMLKPLIGYPDYSRDYSKIVINRDKAFESMVDASVPLWERSTDMLAKPFNRDLWTTTPQTVNAFYNPLMNRFMAPAAILQPPYFDPKADPAENYGAIGAIIGHEMSHGFDDLGRQYDGRGARRNWWSAETNGKFLAATANLMSQYSAMCPYERVCVNGRMTLGENIGDLAGAEIAYAAYRLSLQGQEAPVIGGMTGDQRFFRAYAASMRQKIRPEAMRTQMLTDVHAPNPFRVNGVVRNMDAWYTAFDVKPGDKMYLAPEQRVRLW